MLDCNKKREFNFLIQAHDCSTPSVPSRKIPVKIQVADHDDYSLKFEQSGVYTQNMVASDGIYENFMSVRARDLDCTNAGFACSYKLLLSDLSEVDQTFPFRVDSNGSLSTVRAIRAGEFLEFKVRAFDCVSKESFVDAEVIVKVVEPCVPQFFDYATEISLVTSSSNSVGLFESVKTTSCQEQNKETVTKSDECTIDSVSSVVALKMDSTLREECALEKEKCSDSAVETKQVESSSRFVLFEAENDDDDNDANDSDDDSIETEMQEEEENNAGIKHVSFHS